MMQTISVENFKGYKNQVPISLEGKSLLLFGENGAGKSSLYDALRYFFFKKRIEDSLSLASTPAEERTQIINDYRSNLCFAHSTKPFSILINGQDSDTIDRGAFNAFFISPQELRTQDEIVLSNQLNDWFYDTNSEKIFSTLSTALESEINVALKDIFRENISIRIDNSDHYRVIVKDEITNRIHGKELQTHFNESRLRLIQILLMLEVVHLSYEEGKNNVLVLDDLVVSLDAANRTFIIQYILRYFDRFQVLLLTHSSGFFDLFRFGVNQKRLMNWKYASVYNSNGNCCYYEESESLAVDLSLVSDADPDSLKKAGNLLRRKFEILVHKVARHLLIGSLEESKTLLEKLLSQPTLYRYGEFGPEWLLDWVYSTASAEPYKDSPLGKTIIKRLSLSRLNLEELQDILTKMILFQKVALHPSSHAISGAGRVGPVYKKELEESVRIIDSLETAVNRIVSHNEALF